MSRCGLVDAVGTAIRNSNDYIFIPDLKEKIKEIEEKNERKFKN